MDLNLNKDLKKQVSEALRDGGFGGSGWKLFFKGDLLNTSALTHTVDINHGDRIFANQSFGKPKLWRRFPQQNQWSGWGMNPGGENALTFIPNKSVAISGMEIYGPCYESQYYFKYEVKVNRAS